ncbi:hypothetical protein OG689_44605 [Kitasatospora sp. NBC_00240]|uniref:hypothetical protein n=1 Tax=Kitasatospora sp. NBC_00240 TaxID=2903567 RepID=UPI0022549E6D|nr:hypothetical protein [Kitasatospora sp. NBC_00240]MCX5216221.1 hypothetical protein [Kitasatospora sp. NBC_00240]
MTGDRSAIARRFAAGLPEQLAALPKDPRGFPITFVTAVGTNGVADFTEVDGPRRAKAIIGHLCGVCGQPLPLVRAVIGGPQVLTEHLSFAPRCAWSARCSPQRMQQPAAPSSSCPEPGTAKGIPPESSPRWVAGQRMSSFFLARTFAHDAVRVPLPDGSDDILALCARWTSVEEISGGTLTRVPS